MIDFTVFNGCNIDSVNMVVRLNCLVWVIVQTGKVQTNFAF